MAASLPRAGMLVLAAVGLAQVLVTLDYFSLTVALPQMAHDLDVTTTDMQWALTAYLVSFASLMVAGGRIGDILGRRRTLLVGIVVFGAASLLCGLAYDEYMLVACRVLQGIGAAILFPVSMGVVGNAFDEETRPRAIGIVVLVSTVGTALGPLVGGVLTDALDWRWVFLLNVPFSVLAAVMVMLFVSESRDETVSRHVDYRGVVTLSAAIVALTLVIDRGPTWADSDPAALAGCLVAVVALFVAFVLLERRVESPLVDLPTFRSHGFVMVTVSGFLSNFLWALSVFVATLWLQDVKGLSPLESGLAFLAMSAGVACAGPLSGRLVVRHDVGGLMAIAALIGAAGAVGVSLVDALPAWLPLFGVLGLGVGVNYALVNQGALASVPPEKAGAASGIALTALVIGAAVATVLAATLLEELSGGQGVDQDAVDTVLRVGALAGVGAALPAGMLWLRRRRAVGAEQPEAA
ncbi:MAG TPA: MFS transporter [Miltoncostaeaceae bacterium]|nr:MFS transporter [Miltoncostaeaceae bacterium]